MFYAPSAAWWRPGIWVRKELLCILARSCFGFLRHFKAEIRLLSQKLQRKWQKIIRDSFLIVMFFKILFPSQIIQNFCSVSEIYQKVIKTMKSKLHPKHETSFSPKLLTCFNAKDLFFKREVIAWFSFHHCCLIWHHPSLQFIIIASLLLIIIIMISILSFQPI